MVDKTEGHLYVEKVISKLGLSSNPTDHLLIVCLKNAVNTFESIRNFLVLNNNGSFNTQENQDAIAEAISNILKTAPGERIDSSAVQMGTSIPSTVGLKPVDTSNRVLVSGEPVPEDGSHRELKENGQQKDYIVLSQEEIAKGYVRPLRTKYIHAGIGAKFQQFSSSWALVENGKNGCGVMTRMSDKIAQTYAVYPKFYKGTFCCGCNKHFPLEEFVWDGTNEIVGS